MSFTPPRTSTLRLGRLRPADAGLSRRGMGRPRARLRGALGKARSRRLPGRPGLDHRAPQARRLPRGLRRLRPGDGRALRRGRHPPTARQYPGIIRSRAKIEAAIGGARIFCDMAARGEDFTAYCVGLHRRPRSCSATPAASRPSTALSERSRRISSAAASGSSALPSSMPGCRPWASSTIIPSTCFRRYWDLTGGGAFSGQEAG